MALERVEVEAKHPQIIYVAPTFDAAYVFYDLVMQMAQDAQISAGIVSHNNQSN